MGYCDTLLGLGHCRMEVGADENESGGTTRRIKATVALRSEVCTKTYWYRKVVPLGLFGGR